MGRFLLAAGLAMIGCLIPAPGVAAPRGGPMGGAAARADGDLTGRWEAHSEGGSLTVEFGPDGRITLVERRAAGVQTTRGRYEVGNGVIQVLPDGAQAPLRYPFRFTPEGLVVTDQDGTLLSYRRAEGVLPAAAPPPALPAPSGRCQRATVFVPWHCMDQGGIQHPATGQPLEVFFLWVPQGWRIQGGITWKLHHKSVHTIERADLINPAQIAFQLVSPDGEAAVTVYPGEPFTDLSGAPAAPLFPRGSNYGGTTVWPPLGPTPYVQQILLPRYFQNVQGLQVLSARDLPQLATFFRAESLRFNQIAGLAGIAQLTFAAGTTVVEFTAQGTVFREQFVTAPMYLSMPGMVMWWPHMAWSIRAPRACFDRMLPTLLTSIYSFRLNGLWYLLYKRIVDNNWKGVAAVDATIRQIDDEIVRSQSETASLIHRQLYPVLTGMASKSAPGYAPVPLDAGTDHAVDENGNLRELPAGSNPNDLPPGWKPLVEVPVK